MGGRGLERHRGFCAEVAETCKEASIEPEGTTLSASLKSKTKSTLVTSAGTMSCESSSLSGKTTEKEDVPLSIEVTTLSFSSCKIGLAKCTVSSLHLPFAAVMYAGSSGSGTIYLDEGKETEKETEAPGQEVICSGLITCTYSTPEIELGLTGGAPAGMVAKEVPLTGEGKTCATATWSAEYSATAPNSGQIGAAQGSGLTKLCKANEASCTKTYAALQVLKGPQLQTVSLILQPDNTQIDCPESMLEGRTEQESGVALRTEFSMLTFVNCKTGANNCTVKTLGLPYVQTAITKAVPPFGPAGDGMWQMRLRLEISCAGAGIEGCQYEKLAAFRIEGGNPGRVWAPVATGTLLRKPGGTACGRRVRLGVAYPLNIAPNATIFVTG